MRRIDTAAADFAIAVAADCFITRYGQIFELNDCTVDCEAAAILRISAAGNRTVFHGNLRFITGNGHNRRICITRQRKPAEVERQRLIDGDILRNITEQNDGFATVCCSNRGSNSRILVLADLCSVFRCYGFVGVSDSVGFSDSAGVFDVDVLSPAVVFSSAGFTSLEDWSSVLGASELVSLGD